MNCPVFTLNVHYCTYHHNNVPDTTAILMIFQSNEALQFAAGGGDGGWQGLQDDGRHLWEGQVSAARGWLPRALVSSQDAEQ